MTIKEKIIIERFFKKIKKEAITDWIKDGNFQEWFWDRASVYVIREDEIKYLEKRIKQMVDK